MHGLTRVRGFTQDDAHIFCTPDQVKAEFLKVMDIIFIIFRALEFEDFEAQISLRDPKDREKYIGSDGMSPKVNKLGGKDWYRMKERVRGSIATATTRTARVSASPSSRTARSNRK